MEDKDKNSQILRIAIFSILGFIIIGIPLAVLITLYPPQEVSKENKENLLKFFWGVLIIVFIFGSLIGTIKDYNVNKKQPCYANLDFWSLILANLLTIVIAMVQNWPLGSVVLVYWCQSFTIGIFWFFKILKLKDFSMKDYKIIPIQFKSARQAKLKIAYFFLFHYGCFHLGFLYILLTKIKYTFSASVILVAFTFFLCNYFSFFYNNNWKTPGKPNIQKMVNFPYVRIFPIGFTIFAVLGNWDTQWILVLVLLLKTVADSAMYMVENAGFNDKPKTATR